MAQSYLSLERAKTLLVEIVETSPPRSTNARCDAGACVYDDGNGNHCIVGEILYRMGMPLPPMNGPFTPHSHIGMPYVEKGYMTAETANWLWRVQSRFYQRQDGGAGPPLTWRQALKMCRQDGLL